MLFYAQYSDQCYPVPRYSDQCRLVPDISTNAVPCLDIPTNAVSCLIFRPMLSRARYFDQWCLMSDILINDHMYMIFVAMSSHRSIF
ncbi:hypothetical protein SLA2020_207030 [Shorea laevis]